MTRKRDIAIYPREDNERLVGERLESLNDLGRRTAQPGNYRQMVLREISNSRRKVLRLVERSIRSHLGALPTLFISYSGLGKPYAMRAKETATKFGFQVRTGFDDVIDIAYDEQSGDTSLPQAIISQIISSSCFLGIWTDDYLTTKNRSGIDGRGNALPEAAGTIPSVWLPFELGVAASHQLPFRLLVLEGTHRHYCEQPFHFKKQIMFEGANFERKLNTVMEYFEKRVQARLAADEPKPPLRMVSARWDGDG